MDNNTSLPSEPHINTERFIQELSALSRKYGVILEPRNEVHYQNNKAVAEAIIDAVEITHPGTKGKTSSVAVRWDVDKSRYRHIPYHGAL